MTAEAILAEINQVFGRVFQNPAIVVTSGTTANDVAEWDSLNHTVLISAVEQHFKIKFTLKEVMRFQNVGDMCTLVRTKVGG